VAEILNTHILEHRILCPRGEAALPSATAAYPVAAAVSLSQRNVLLALARWPPSSSPLPDGVLLRHDARRLHRRPGPCGRVVVAAADAAARRVSPALPRGPRTGTHPQLRCAGAAPRSRLRCRAVSTRLTSAFGATDGTRLCGATALPPPRCFAAMRLLFLRRPSTSVAIWRQVRPPSPPLVYLPVVSSRILCCSTIEFSYWCDFIARSHSSIDLLQINPTLHMSVLK
jgi:hypothetical protein